VSSRQRYPFGRSAITQRSRCPDFDEGRHRLAQREEVTTMRKELSFAELDSERVELLPARETLTYFGNHNWAAVYASNSSLAFNAASIHSSANSAAVQTVATSQS
jgi:hypothetical protein